MNRVILLLSIFFTSIYSPAQQDPFLTTEGFGPFIHNPASFGALNGFSIQSVGRLQWMGLNSAPKTLAINTGAELIGFINKEKTDKRFRLGVGLNSVFQESGIIKYQSFNVPLNFQFKIKSSYLSIGLAPGLFRTNYFQFGSALQTNFDMNAGIFWYSKKFYGGFSVTHIIPSSFNGWILARHYSLHGAYNFDVGNGRIIPMLQTKFDGAGAAIQMLAYYQFPKDIVTVGVGYRYDASVILSGRAQFKGFRLGYAIDYHVRTIVNNHPWSHEFRLGFAIPTRD